MRAPDRRHVAALGVRRQVVDVAVAARGEHHGVAEVRLHLAADEVARDDAARASLDHDDVEHLGAGKHLHLSRRDLPAQGLIGAEQELLASLSPRIERPRHLSPAEGSIGELPAVLAREWHSLGGALIDDAQADLGQAVDVGFARAKIAALDRVVEQAPHRVAVVLVVLGGVDAALRGDRVGAARAVLETERAHVVAELGERGRCRGSRQPRPHHEDRVLALVRRVDELQLETMPLPALLERPRRAIRS